MDSKGRVEIVGNASDLPAMKFPSVSRIAGFFLLISGVCLCSTKFEDGDESCADLVPVGYLKYRPPPTTDIPLSVFVQFEIIDIDEVDEENMDFRLHLYINTNWNDSRLNFTGIESEKFYSECYKYIWLPDVIFEEAKIITDLGKHSSYFYFSKAGTLTYIKRYSFKVSCLMVFHKYPFDTQRCPFSVTFMSTQDTEACLKWLDDKMSPYKSEDPLKHAIRMVKENEPLQFQLEMPTTSKLVKEFSDSNYSYIVANFIFTRRLTGSVVNIYLPSSLIVAVSWFTFWLRIDAASERVTLSITCLLTLCYQVQQYKSQLPPVNYITAMDIWLFTCIFMVFSTLVEFAVSYNRFHSKRKELPYTVQDENSIVSLKFPTETKLEMDGNRDKIILSEIPSVSKKRFGRKLASIWSKKSNGLDILCRFLFPLSFLMFTTAYLGHYLDLK